MHRNEKSWMLHISLHSTHKFYSNVASCQIRLKIRTIVASCAKWKIALMYMMYIKLLYLIIEESEAFRNQPYFVMIYNWDHFSKQNIKFDRIWTILKMLFIQQWLTNNMRDVLGKIISISKITSCKRKRVVDSF